MTYNGWKMMDKITVAVRTGDKSFSGFTGYVVDAGDEEALEKAKDWARTQTWDPVTRKHTETHEPKVYTFDNEGFTVRVMDSAGGSSQGGRLSFWQCEVEKDGVKFSIGVNDEILAGLIKSSDMHNGEVKQKVMFARKQGQPGLIHEGMQFYQDAVADMKHKAEMKKAKKTNKWEIGGVYQTITQTDICFGEVWDTMEEVEAPGETGWYGRRYTKTVLQKRKKPVKILAWTYLSSYRHEDGIPTSFTDFLKEELGDGNRVYFATGNPPARAKTQQLDVTDEDLKLIDKLLAAHEEYSSYYSEEKIKGRYKRVK